MKSFWSGFFAAVLNAAVNGAASASNSGADIKTVGVAAGTTSIAGILAFLLSHPFTSHPAVSAAVVSLPAPVPATA